MTCRAIQPGSTDAFGLQIVYSKTDRRIEISATISQAVADALHNAKDLPQEVNRVAQTDIAGARYVPPCNARIVQRYRLAA